LPAPPGPAGEPVAGGAAEPLSADAGRGPDAAGLEATVFTEIPNESESRFAGLPLYQALTRFLTGRGLDAAGQARIPLIWRLRPPWLWRRPGRAPPASEVDPGPPPGAAPSSALPGTSGSSVTPALLGSSSLIAPAASTSAPLVVPLAAGSALALPAAPVEGS